MGWVIVVDGSGGGCSKWMFVIIVVGWVVVGADGSGCYFGWGIVVVGSGGGLVVVVVSMTGEEGE